MTADRERFLQGEEGGRRWMWRDVTDEEKMSVERRFVHRNQAVVS